MESLKRIHLENPDRTLRNYDMTKDDELYKKTIIFFEHPRDIAVYLERKQAISGIHILLATIPEVSWELEIRGIPFTGIELFYNPDHIYSKGMDNYAITETLCSSIDAAFQERNPLIKKYGFHPARDNFYFLKMLFDNLTLRIQMVQAVIASENPDRVIIFRNGLESRDMAFQDFPFQNDERLFSLILKNGKWGFHLTELTYSPDGGVSLPQRKISGVSNSHIVKKLKQYPLLFLSLHTAKNHGITTAVAVFLLHCVNPVIRKKTLFLLRGDPSWLSIIPELYKSGYHIKFLPEKKELISEGRVFDDDLHKKVVNLLQQHCTCLSVDFHAIVESRLLPLLRAYCNSLPQIVKKIEERILHEKPSAFLCSEKASFIEHLFAHLAQYHSIPVIAWQNGDGPFYPPMQIFVEIMDSDIHLSYGPHHQKMLQKAPQNHFNCRIESTGSLMLEQMYKKNQPAIKRRRILYVTTGYSYNRLYVNCYPHHDNTLWAHQKKILRVLGRQKHPVCLKLAPDRQNTGFISDYIRREGLNSISIIQNERTFLDLLTYADTVICDYASTPVIESIANHKTVFVLLDNPFLQESAVALLKKRVYWSDNIEEFTTMISLFLAGKPINQKPDINNIEYLEQCGIHKYDGKVAERVLTIIDKK
jgi:hypothetical protein